MYGPAKRNNHKAEKIAYAIWLFGESIEKDIDSPTLRDRTLSWLRFGFQGSVIESSSIKSILNQAWECGHDACFIQTPGNIISEDWALPHWGQIDFHTYLNQSLERNDFLVCADLIKTRNYYALNTKCFLVNLNQYQSLGRPDFGHITQQTQALIKPELFNKSANSSSINTKQLEPSNELISIAPTSHGWNFIDSSLRQGLVVPELPKSISDKCLSLTSTPLSLEAQENQLYSSRKRFLRNVETQISRGRTGVFLWNIESYDDIPTGNPETAYLTETAGRHKIRNLYCVAAGFKPNILLHRHGFEPDAGITFFDYSQQALDVRKTLLDEWDGSDYPEFCRELMQRFPAEKTFYQLWNGLQPSQIDWTDVNRLWEVELIHWGGAKNFQKQWLAHVKLKYDFLHCDIVNNPTPLLERIHDSAGTVIWWSNAFFTISSNWLLSIEHRRKSLQYWINHLAERSPQCRLYGADHNNTPVNNINAAEYAAALKNRSKNNEYNELTPHHESALPLRF